MSSLCVSSCLDETTTRVVYIAMNATTSCNYGGHDEGEGMFFSSKGICVFGQYLAMAPCMYHNTIPARSEEKTYDTKRIYI